MRIFLSAEIEGPATSKWFELQKEFNLLLLGLNGNNYGDSLESIGIISIILRPEFLSEGGYKERKLYSKKTKRSRYKITH